MRWLQFATAKPEDISLFARQCRRGWRAYVLKCLNIYPASFVRCRIICTFLECYYIANTLVQTAKGG